FTFRLCLYQVGVGLQDFLLRSALFYGSEIGLSGAELSACTRSFGARAGVIQLHQKLTRTNRVTFLDEQLSDCGGCHRAGLEVVYRFDLAVRGDRVRDGAAFYRPLAHRYLRAAHE